MTYWPNPEKIDRNYIDMEVAINLDDAFEDTKYGTLVDIDKEGNLYVATGNKKPKKFAPTDDIQLLIIQAEQGIRFVNPNLFDSEDLNNLDKQEVQDKIHGRLEENFKKIDTTKVSTEERIDKIMEGKKQGKKTSSKKKPVTKKKTASKKKSSSGGRTVNGVQTVC